MKRGGHRTDVAWVSCEAPPDADHDEELGLAALARAGLSVEKVAWDDPSSSPARYHTCILRSCWNYFEDPAAFAEWLRGAAASSILLNGLDVALWNLHKRYLISLEQAGVPIVATALVDRGEELALRELVTARGWAELVVKPAISAGSFATRRFSAQQIAQAQAFLDEHLAARDMMVQRFVPSVETVGERCFVWIAGELTHAIDKRPRFSGDEESVSEALPVGAAERELCEAVLRAAARAGSFDLADLLYARIDTVELDGQRVLGELELLEPSLFLLQAPAALERFVEAVAARVGAVARSGDDDGNCA